MKDRLLKLAGAVRALATEYPNAIYKAVGGNTCSYEQGDVIDGPPGAVGCIMKHAAMRVGDTDLLARMSKHPECSLIALLDGLTPALKHDRALHQLLEWLRYVQRRQDDQIGVTWGTAVLSADIAWPSVKEMKSD